MRFEFALKENFYNLGPSVLMSCILMLQGQGSNPGLCLEYWCLKDVSICTRFKFWPLPWIPKYWCYLELLPARLFLCTYTYQRYHFDHLNSAEWNVEISLKKSLKAGKIITTGFFQNLSFTFSSLSGLARSLHSSSVFPRSTEFSGTWTWPIWSCFEKRSKS